MSNEYTHVSKDMPPSRWDKAKTYQKVALTKAVKMDGPFIVDTSEGPLTCEDGYCAMDARGYYYPIATEEFDKIYVEVGDEAPVEVE